MPIEVKCANADCGKTMRVKDELAGKTIRCPGCQQPLKVQAPAVEAMPEEEVTAEAPPPKPAKSNSVAAKSAPAAVSAGKAPAKAAAAAPAAKKGGGKPARRDDDDRDPEMEKLWQTCDMLNNHERLQVKRKFSFMGSSFYINNPDTEEKVGMAKEVISIVTVLMRALPIVGKFMGTNIEIREDDKGPVLFTVRKPVQWFNWTTKIEIYDQHAEKIGYFQTKLFSLLPAFWVYDAEGNQIAEVKQPLSFTKPRVDFLAADGRELAQIRNELWEAKKMKLMFGNPGMNINMSEEVKSHHNLKVLLIATVIALEFISAARAGQSGAGGGISFGS
jgi:uncharacterized protein YxjI